MNYLDRVADEIRREVPSDALPSGDSKTLFLLYAVLLLAKHEDVTREDVHNAWVAWMDARGVVHEAMVPYGELEQDTKAEDSPYVVAIRTVAARMQSQ